MKKYNFDVTLKILDMTNIAFFIPARAKFIKMGID